MNFDRSARSCTSASRHATLAMIFAGFLCGCAALPPAGVLPTGPSAGDLPLSPFYAWTAPLPQQAGVLLRSEPMPSQPEITAASSGKRILYTSTDARWRSGVLPVSGTLYLPKGQPPKGGWPLVAWAHGTLGVSDVCAPSWALHRPRDATYINSWLEKGFAVVATDYQGLGGPGPHTYLIWEAEGRSVLDSIRAALASNEGAIANQIIITGQSQGSGASLGASRIAPSYAPELKLRATIATGIVSTFPDGPYKLAHAVPGRGAPAHYTVLAMIGGSIPDGGPSIESLMSEKGRALLKPGREGCSPDMQKVAREQGIDALNAFSMDPVRLEAMLLHVTDMTPVRLPAPVFLGTGLADRTLAPRRQYAAVSALCAGGSTVLWKTYPGITHNGGVMAAFNDELDFVSAVLANRPVPTNCDSLVEPGTPGAPKAGAPFND